MRLGYDHITQRTLFPHSHNGNLNFFGITRVPPFEKNVHLTIRKYNHKDFDQKVDLKGFLLLGLSIALKARGYFTNAKTKQ